MKEVESEKEKMDEKAEKMPVETIPNKVKIIIDQQEGDENQQRVFVSVNGYGYSIQRGIEVEVPESVVEVLKNAIQTKMFQNIETGVVTFRDVPRISFKVTK